MFGLLRYLQRHLLWRFDLLMFLRGSLTLGYSVIGGVVVILLLGDVISDTNELVLALIAMVGPLALLAVGHLRYWMLAVFVVDIPYAFDIFLFWNPSGAVSGAIAGLNVSLTSIAMATLYGMWFVDKLTHQEERETSLSLWNAWTFIPYLTLVCMSILWARDPTLSFYEIGMLLQVLFLFIYIVGTIRTREDITYILMMMMIALIAESFYVVLQRFVFRTGGYVPGSNIYHIRVTGHFGSPNVSGGYLAFMSISALGIMSMPVKNILRYLAAIALVLGGLALFFTLSRGAWVAFVIGVAIWSMMMFIRGWLPSSAVVGGILLLCIVGFAFSDILIARLFGDDGGAGEGRLPLNEIALIMAEQNLIKGIGTNNFAVALPDYLDSKYSGIWLYTVHNKYLLVFSELGLFGLLSFLFYLGMSVYRGMRLWFFKEDRYLAILGLTLASSVLGHAFHLQVDVFNYRGPVQWLAVHSALVTSCYFLMLRERKNKPSAVP